MRLDKSRLANLVRTDFGQQMLAEGDRAQAGNVEANQVWNLLISEVEADPDQPRRHFDEAALQDLAADIARRGVLQPILVHPNGDRYRIIVGERRWRASQIAGKARIPCIIREMGRDEIRQTQLVENVIREGISDVERGLALRQLYEDMKSSSTKTTWEQVAQIVGLTRMSVNRLYSLSTLPKPIVDWIQARRLSGSHGMELARLQDHPDMQMQLAQQSCRREVGANGFGLSVCRIRPTLGPRSNIESEEVLPPLHLTGQHKAVVEVEALGEPSPARQLVKSTSAPGRVRRYSTIALRVAAP